MPLNTITLYDFVKTCNCNKRNYCYDIWSRLLLQKNWGEAVSSELVAAHSWKSSVGSGKVQIFEHWDIYPHSCRHPPTLDQSGTSILPVGGQSEGFDISKSLENEYSVFRLSTKFSFPWSICLDNLVIIPKFLNVNWKNMILRNNSKCKSMIGSPGVYILQI